MRDMHRWCTDYAWFKVGIPDWSESKFSPGKRFSLHHTRTSLCSCLQDPTNFFKRSAQVSDKTRNFVKRSALNCRFFKELCRDIERPPWITTILLCSFDGYRRVMSYVGFTNWGKNWKSFYSYKKIYFCGCIKWQKLVQVIGLLSWYLWAFKQAKFKSLSNRIKSHHV